jgi:hypothetical protein
VGTELPFEELPEVAAEVRGLVEVEDQAVTLFFKHASAQLSKRKRRTVIDESIDDSHRRGLLTHELSLIPAHLFMGIPQFQVEIGRSLAGRAAGHFSRVFG